MKNNTDWQPPGAGETLLVLPCLAIVVWLAAVIILDR